MGCSSMIWHANCIPLGNNCDLLGVYGEYVGILKHICHVVFCSLL